MGMQTLASALEREHREIDAGIDSFTSGSRAGDALSLSGAIQALRRHIYLEEEFLFPSLRQGPRALSAAVLVMLREHGEMWRVLDEIDEQLAAGGPSGELLDACRALTGQLQAHNPKEEQILYPQTDQVLSESARAELRELLDQGRTPEGWVCEGLSS